MINRRASAGGAPAPRQPAARTTCALSRARGTDHAPPADGASLDDLKHGPLEPEPEDADDHERAQHHVGPEELLRIEDHPAKAPAGRGDHLAADHGDPRAGERLAKPGDDEGERPGQHDLPEELAATRAHGLGRANPDAVDRSDTGPCVQDDRERGRIEDQGDAGRVAQAEPEDEDGNPGQRRDRREHAHQGKHEPLGDLETPHQDADRHPHQRGQAEPPQDAIERVGDVNEDGAADDHLNQRGDDHRQRRRERGGEETAPRERFPHRGREPERDDRADDEPLHRSSIPHRTTVNFSMRSNTSFSRASPRSPITAIPASITSVFRNSRAPKISQPRPIETEVGISAAISTRHARANPSRSPVSTYGSAPGRTTFRKSWPSVAPMVSAARIQMLFTALTPVHALTTTGNAVENPTSSTAGRLPRPNHRTNRGA